MSKHYDENLMTAEDIKSEVNTVLCHSDRYTIEQIQELAGIASNCVEIYQLEAVMREKSNRLLYAVYDTGRDADYDGFTSKIDVDNHVVNEWHNISPEDIYVVEADKPDNDEFCLWDVIHRFDFYIDDLSLNVLQVALDNLAEHLFECIDSGDFNDDEVKEFWVRARACCDLQSRFDNHYLEG